MSGPNPLVFQKSCQKTANPGMPGGQMATEAPTGGKLVEQLGRKGGRCVSLPK